MIDTSVFGSSAQIVATNTFPNGFTVTEFADDADPLDSPDLAVAATAMGPNGDLVTWSAPQGIEMSVNVIPNSDSDTNLYALLDANRVSKGKSGARDVVTLVWTYPDGNVITGSQGKLISGPMIASGTSGGRLKTKRYVFHFQNVTRSRS
jgi:hypothetical protein